MKDSINQSESRFVKAKSEHASTDENGKYQLVYSYFGLAIYYGQCIEETFSIMLWTDQLFKKNPKTNKEVNDLIDAIENSKKTMGNFINEVNQNYKLDPSIVDQLAVILEKRNYLVHKYFKHHISKFHSEVGQLEMIQYFCEFIDESTALDKKLNDYYKNYTDRLGLTDEKLEEILIQLKTDELNRVKKEEKVPDTN